MHTQNDSYSNSSLKGPLCLSESSVPQIYFSNFAF